MTERTRATIKFLGSVEATKAERPDSHKAEKVDLREGARRLLERATLEPQEPLTSHYGAAGLTAAKGREALDDLLGKGYVRLHHVSPRGRGGRVTLVEVLEAANSLIVKLGLQRRGRLLKGGWLHDVVGRYLENWTRARGLTHSFERTYGTKTYDMVHEEDGQLVAWEVCVSGTANWNAAQALKGLENEGIRELRIVCRDVKSEQQIQKAIGEQDPHGIYSDRVKTWVIGDLFR